LLPALQITRRPDVFDLMTVLGQQGVLEILAVQLAADGLAHRRSDH
jgi:hypothetical protein